MTLGFRNINLIPQCTPTVISQKW